MLCCWNSSTTYNQQTFCYTATYMQLTKVILSVTKYSRLSTGTIANTASIEKCFLVAKILPNTAPTSTVLARH